MSKYFSAVVLLWVILSPTSVSSQTETSNALPAQPTAALPLTTEQLAAVNAISENQVVSTVSFLASDEMAGRDTPSTELTIATAYVAARFRGAGLEPLGDGDRFYQVYEMPMSMPPALGTVVSMDGGGAILHKGLLAAGDNAVDLSATVLTEQEAMATQNPEVVLLDELPLPPGAVGRPSLVIVTLARRIRALSNKGVKAIFMKCGPESVLPEVAVALLQKPSRNVEGLRPECPVLLVDATEELAGKKVNLSVPAQETLTVEVRNVIGVLNGSDPELAPQAILISAHLDHIGTRSEGADLINNGADDNATGVTAVLSLADAFASLPNRPKRSLIFATFWGEEKGLLGSKQFAKTPTWPMDKIVANVNIEMVGRPEPDAREKAWMTGWKHSNLGNLMNAGSSRVNVEIFDRQDIGETLYSRSDNYSLVEKGVVAHSFSAGSLHSDYHQPSDEWQKLDIPHMTRVIQGLFAGTLHIADSDVEVLATK
ncbi:MAG: M28 family peptidase [Fuerstiella sp.]